MKRFSQHNGFTLIELITVMVILGVIASFSTTFVVSVMRSAVNVNEQNQLLTNSQLTTEYMIRRLRNALPFSLRITNDGACLQFMPIVSSGLYLDILPSDANGAFATGSFTPIAVSPFIISDGQAGFLAIAASSIDEIYGVNPRSLAAIDSVTSNSITLTDDKRWLRNSINQRFYIAESPSAFCLFDNELRLYRDVGIENVLVNAASEYDLLTLSAEALGDAFTLSSAIEDRNVRMTLSLLFVAGQHRIETVKQVVVRNVP
ncbi:MAG: MSHA biogenesis protein MshO [Granulosicoccus sp.]|jgi:MSHA biogenesis protein MshO